MCSAEPRAESPRRVSCFPAIVATAEPSLSRVVAVTDSGGGDLVDTQKWKRDMAGEVCVIVRVCGSVGVGQELLSHGIQQNIVETII